MSENNNWRPIMLSKLIPKNTEIEVIAKGRGNGILDRETMNSDNLRASSFNDNGLYWTHWRITENNEKLKK